MVAGIYPTFAAAQKSMGSGFEKTYIPDRSTAEEYKALYQKYLALGKFEEEGIL